MRTMSRMLFFSLLLVPGLLFAGTMGKIKGKVIDKESKEALVGANVSVEGTTMGAASDVDGEYTILNVPAGFYTIKATFVGYAAVEISNVRVNNDLTTELNFSMSSEAVALQTVEIVAERPLINKSATNAVRITTSEDIEGLAVRGINGIIALSPGVVLQDNTVFIRGGRQDEVGFYLEGTTITNPMVGGRAVTLVQDAIEEIQVQAGGYNAEFGGANSGIVQQQLKTGTSDWKASLNYATDNTSFRGKDDRYAGKKSLGAFWWGYDEMTGTLSGPLGDERFKFFGLANYNYIRDPAIQAYPGINLGVIHDAQTGDSVDLQYPAGPALSNAQRQLTYTSTLTMDFKPLTVRLAGTYTNTLGNNVFNTSRNAGNIANFLNAGRTERVRAANGSGTIKLTHAVSSNIFYEVSAGYFNQTQTNDDPFLGDDFMNYGDSVVNAEHGFVWTRKPTEQTVGRFIRPQRLNVLTFSFNAPGDVQAGYAKFKRENWTFNGSVYTILDEHSIKVGGEYQRYTMRNYSLGNEAVFAIAGLIYQNNLLPDGDPLKLTNEQIMINRGVNNFGYDVFGNESDAAGVNAPKHPVFASAYIQDKAEYSDLVINFGLRFDYINSDSKTFVDPSRPELTINKNTGEIIQSGLVDVATFSAVSPRVGFSFPVTDRTVFHTQYGKFVQQSRLRDIYQGLYLTGSNIRGGFFIPAPVGFDIRPTRTTQYEIGFTQQIGEFASFDITGYYKDIQDQVVYDQQNTAPGSLYQAYFILKNGDFATTKGIELTFNMRRQKRLQVTASMAFQDARGTGSYPNSNRGLVGAPIDGITIFRPQYITPLEFNNSFRGNLNVDYRFGKNDGGSILQQLGASVLVSVNSGHPFTKGIGGADLEGDARDRQPTQPLNSSTTPWSFNVDLRVDKTFPLFDKLSANVYVFVLNLFDTRNIQNVFLRTGSVDDDGYLSTAGGSQLASSLGPEYVAMYKAINIDYYEQYQNAPGLTTTPTFFAPPRQVRFGIRLDY